MRADALDAQCCRRLRASRTPACTRTRTQAPEQSVGGARKLRICVRRTPVQRKERGESSRAMRLRTHTRVHHDECGAFSHATPLRSHAHTCYVPVYACTPMHRNPVRGAAPKPCTPACE